MNYTKNFQLLLFQSMGMFFQHAIYFCFIYPQGAIIIHEVYEEGAAFKDGRLWAGDQILEVCWFLWSLLLSSAS